VRCGYDGLMRSDRLELPSTRTAAQQAVVGHITSFFAGRSVEVFEVDDGPIQTRVPGFAEICVTPTASDQLWVYVSCGVWDAVHGPEFEMCHWERGHARILWLLPITESERDFRGEHGLEALEQRFDDASLHYWDPQRAAVV
jgi:Suppressor of fused protein (SUFU)